MRTYDADYDIACDLSPDVLEIMVAAELTIVDYLRHGPGGGNPMVSLRGTREGHKVWQAFYDPDQLSPTELVEVA